MKPGSKRLKCAQPAAIRLVDMARPGRATPEPLRLTIVRGVIDLLDGVNDHTLARSLPVMCAC